MSELSPLHRALAVSALGYVGYKVVQRLREQSISGEVAVVTGGSRGLGYLLARELVREGCPVVICAREQEELDWAREDLEMRGGQVLAVVCDVSKQEDVDRLIAEATQRFGRVDILVNNAGEIQVAPVRDATIDDFERAMAVMFWGVLRPTLAVLPQMTVRQTGRIVNITSFGGFVSSPHLIPYSSAKFAAVGLSQGLHAELAQDGIAVTTVAPWLMRTGSYFNAQFRGEKEQEFVWFSLGSALPLISMNAERAARLIISGVKRRSALVIPGVPGNVIARFHGLFPGTTANLLSVINRVLPQPSGKHAQDRGIEVQHRLRSRLLNMATVLGRSAAEDYQPQLRGRVP